jgi:hypothetical protein
VKKILLIIFIFVLISALLFGCGSQTVQVELYDKISALGIVFAKTCTVDGDNLPINGSKISVPPGQHTIQVDGYNDAEITVEKDSRDAKVVLTPKAYLEILTNENQETIVLDGVNLQYITALDISSVLSQQEAEKPRLHSVVISPVGIGMHAISVSANYFKDFSTNIDIKEGKNTLNAILEPDEKQITELLNSISFPEDIKDYDFKINLSGSLNGVQLSNGNVLGRTLTGSVRNSKISEISDENIDYTFNNGKLYMGGSEVTDNEKLQALLFASNTVQEFMNSKSLIAEFLASVNKENLAIDYDGNSGKIGFGVLKTFEGREIYEDYTITVKNKLVESIILLLDSEALKTNLDVSIQITGR